VDALQPERSRARQPLFQVVLVLHNAPPATLPLPGVRVTFEPLAESIARVDLTVTLTERTGADGEPLGIAGALEYSCDLFDAANAAAIARRFERYLAAVADAPSVPLFDLPVLDAAERSALLNGVNATDRNVRVATIAELFEAQAARTPDADALVSGDASLTYGELNDRANRLAFHLIGCGVGPETLVGVALERSVDLVVALLGIAKSGAPWVPLDPEYPDAWLSDVI